MTRGEVDEILGRPVEKHRSEVATSVSGEDLERDGRPFLQTCEGTEKLLARLGKPLWSWNNQSFCGNCYAWEKAYLGGLALSHMGNIALTDERGRRHGSLRFILRSPEEEARIRQLCKLPRRPVRPRRLKNFDVARPKVDRVE